MTQIGNTSSEGDLVRAVYYSVPSINGELPLEPGEILSVLENHGQWWRGTNARGETGFFPKNYVEHFKSKEGVIVRHPRGDGEDDYEVVREERDPRTHRHRRVHRRYHVHEPGRSVSPRRSPRRHHRDHHSGSARSPTPDRRDSPSRGGGDYRSADSATVSPREYDLNARYGDANKGRNDDGYPPDGRNERGSGGGWGRGDTRTADQWDARGGSPRRNYGRAGEGGSSAPYQRDWPREPQGADRPDRSGGPRDWTPERRPDGASSRDAPSYTERGTSPGVPRSSWEENGDTGPLSVRVPASARARPPTGPPRRISPGAPRSAWEEQGDTGPLSGRGAVDSVASPHRARPPGGERDAWSDRQRDERVGGVDGDGNRGTASSGRAQDRGTDPIASRARSPSPKRREEVGRVDAGVSAPAERGSTSAGPPGQSPTPEGPSRGDKDNSISESENEEELTPHGTIVRRRRRRHRSSHASDAHSMKSVRSTKSLKSDKHRRRRSVGHSQKGDDQQARKYETLKRKYVQLKKQLRGLNRGSAGADDVSSDKEPSRSDMGMSDAATRELIDEMARLRDELAKGRNVPAVVASALPATVPPPPLSTQRTTEVDSQASTRQGAGGDMDTLDSRSGRGLGVVTSDSRLGDQDRSPTVETTQQRLSWHCGRVRVAVRVRPFVPVEVAGGHRTCFAVSQRARSITVRPPGKPALSPFIFDAVFDQPANQADVYDACARDIVDDVLRGCNGTVMAYGQTGSGKTYTLGSVGEGSQGVIPRAIDQIFQHVLTDPEAKYEVTIAMLQNYMEQTQDLLAKEQHKLKLREGGDGIFVENLQERVVTCKEDVMRFMDYGYLRRAVGSTDLNRVSSRSHTILMITVKRTTTAREGDKIRYTTTRGRLSCVDLAGSERVKLSGSSGVRLREAKFINKSLTCIGNVIAALADPNNAHVPYRNSQITRLLQDSLGGNCKTSLIITCTPSHVHAFETISSLGFGQRAMQVVTRAAINQEISVLRTTDSIMGSPRAFGPRGSTPRSNDGSSNVDELLEQISSLKRQNENLVARVNGMATPTPTVTSKDTRSSSQDKSPPVVPGAYTTQFARTRAALGRSVSPTGRVVRPPPLAIPSPRAAGKASPPVPPRVAATKHPRSRAEAAAAASIPPPPPPVISVALPRRADDAFAERDDLSPEARKRATRGGRGGRASARGARGGAASPPAGSAPLSPRGATADDAAREEPSSVEGGRGGSYAERHRSTNGAKPDRARAGTGMARGGAGRGGREEEGEADVRGSTSPSRKTAVANGRGASAPSASREARAAPRDEERATRRGRGGGRDEGHSSDGVPVRENPRVVSPRGNRRRSPSRDERLYAEDDEDAADDALLEAFRESERKRLGKGKPERDLTGLGNFDVNSMLDGMQAADKGSKRRKGSRKDSVSGSGSDLSARVRRRRRERERWRSLYTSGRDA